MCDNLLSAEVVTFDPKKPSEHMNMGSSLEALVVKNFYVKMFFDRTSV